MRNKEPEMIANKTLSVDELRIVSRFQSLRKALLSVQYASHLEKPLAYWALPADRRLPLAFMGRTLDDLLNTPFSQLSGTPGIGHKKICTFLALLSRAANTNSSELSGDLAGPHTNSEPLDDALSNDLDPAKVSEVVWAKWRDTVINRGFQDEALGRFSPCLKNMSRVIWKRPLGDYAELTLAEIRATKTHGEKRVRAILEVFHGIHALVAKVGTQDRLVVRIVPRAIDEVETWVGRTRQTPGIPSMQEIHRKLVFPLLDQVRHDASEQIVDLAEKRLGISAPITSVRRVARTMGLTRARVYQLLNEINDIMTVRWPTGRHQTHELQDKFRADAAAADAPINLTQFEAAVELFYPCSRRGAAGPLDHLSLPVSQDGCHISPCQS